jgi:ribonuclease BN (tRNA processing enzyme)
VNVRFLGSGDAFGSGGRFQTCIHVETGHGQVLVDCGASSLIAMRRFGVDPNDVDAVLLTHLHGDHFAGVPFLVLDGQFRRRSRPLTVVGPRGVEDRVREAIEILFPDASRVERKFAVSFVEWRDRAPQALGAFTATPFEVVHASGAPPYALRIACDGKTLAYSGDTEWTDALVDAARGADLFVAEAYFYEKKIKYHLDLATLLAHRDQLACRRVVVTHMNDDMLRRLPGLAVEAAHDGKVIAL